MEALLLAAVARQLQIAPGRVASRAPALHLLTGNRHFNPGMSNSGTFISPNGTHQLSDLREKRPSQSSSIRPWILDIGQLTRVRTLQLSQSNGASAASDSARSTAMRHGRKWDVVGSLAGVWSHMALVASMRQHARRARTGIHVTTGAQSLW
jgi:hypothetical protein